MEKHDETHEVSVIIGSTVLTVLETTCDTQNASLSFHHCCRRAQCGSCVLLVNGEPYLPAKKEPVPVTSSNH